MHGRSTPQLSFGDGFIDPSLYELNAELKAVNALLSDRALLKPLEEMFDPTMGRPGTPVDVYVRMLFLKFRYGLAYEEVEAEVRERIPWRFFCHLSLMDAVPDATTLIKLNQRLGEDRIRALNKRLVKHLITAKKIKPRKIRIDSTTLETHISYPTDLGLVHQVVNTLTESARKAGHKITNHVRSTKRALAQMGAVLKSKSKDGKQQIHKTLKRVSQLAKDTVEQASAAVAKVPRAKQSPLVKRLSEQRDVAKKILEQIDQRLAGAHSIPERIVSMHDPEARPIRRGKLAKPNEFGRTMQLTQDQSGLMLTYEIQHGNPNDKAKLIPQVKRFIKLFGRPPSQTAADKGYYSPENIVALRNLGVRRVGIAKIGRLKPRERRRQHSRWFKILQRFRCGMEAAISMLKRCFMLGDIRVRGSTATALWVGWSIFSFNLWNSS
jgi:IS5 family transposase